VAESAERRNVLVLAICQALYLASASVSVALSGLVGSMLAPSKALSTLPYSLSVVATASSTVPLSLLMGRLGRRVGFALGALLGAAGAAIACAAIFTRDFPAFCAGNALTGVFQASAQYYRFAAADAADARFRSRAVSWVLTGGVVAAVLGPSLASATKDLFMPARFAGSFLAMAAVALATIPLLMVLRVPAPRAVRDPAGGRPLAAIARQPGFTTAIANCVIGYTTMIFIMTATPLAAVAHHHSSDRAIGIIRLHLIGMFLPSFFTGGLIARYGVAWVMLAGATMSLLAAVVSIAGATLVHFWLALPLLGAGWNFMYVGGTTLLTAVYRPEERAKVQATNEFVTFGLVALASLSSGGVFARFGWQAVNYAVLPLLVLAASTTVWYVAAQRRPAPVQPDGL